jgi:hypothetical protein
LDKRPKITIKDSVFTNLFADPKYQRELYMSLHPGEDIAADELKTVTIANVLTDDIYNDLGFIAKDILREYLTGRESEVLTIMTTLFNQDKITESYGRDKYNSGLSVGMETGKAEQLINSVESAMEFYDGNLEMACRVVGIKPADYNKAKKLLEHGSIYA